MKKLNYYSIEEVIDIYQISRTKDLAILTDWLRPHQLSFLPHETHLLGQLVQELEDGQYAWNEEELKMHFIAPLLRLAKLNEAGKIGTYFERSLSGMVEDYKISVIVDCMLATPKRSGRPDVPYFFLQEYKRSKGDSHDPEGQMLAAMILAQELNQNQKPLYGCWVQGRIWYFTALEGRDYSVSAPFDAASLDDLQQIVGILQSLKNILLQP